MNAESRPVEGRSGLTPNYDGPRFGVTAAEEDQQGNRLYLATIYDRHGAVHRMDGRRLPYGDAFEHAHQWSKSFGALTKRRA